MSKQPEDTGTHAIFASRKDAITHQLLRLGLEMTSRPIDTLIERLTRADGSQWLERMLSEKPFSGRASLTGDSMSLDDLRSLKDESKKFAKGSDPDRPRAMLAYFLAVAFAQSRFDEMLSSRPASEVGPILADLGVALPDELGEACVKAAAAMKR